MGIFSKLNIRPVRKEDVAQLDTFRRQYKDAWLEVPHGLSGTGVETAVAEKDGKLIGSLTAIGAVLMDPFIHDPEAVGVDVYAAVVALERALAYQAQKSGLVDAYIAVPRQSKEYIEICKKSGYEITCENCVIMRRPLRPDTVSLLEHEEPTPENHVE